MTPDEFADQMRAIAEPDEGGPGDLEAAHDAADQLMITVLRSLGYGVGADIFDDMPKWYA